jgi:protein-S-isoprenylcysteine O-methyltransferase Ste14
MLFVPAGSLRFWQAWAFLAVASVFTVFTFVYFYYHDRELLERRIRSGEKLREQRNLVRYMRPAFALVFLLPGLDHRLGWSHMPDWLAAVAEAGVVVGLAIVFWALKVNSFASRTIEVEAGQKVIDSGPYAIVRHPMYAGSLVMWLSMPLALGSYVAWLAFALLAPFYVIRLLHEEKFLEKELPGYREYCERTPFRLISYVW